MKVHSALLLGAFLCQSLFADSLPVFTAHPTNQLCAPGSTVTLAGAAAGADSFQWRHNGIDVPGATNSNLTITNAQTTNAGYYVVIAKNATGWTPSQMVYLNVTSGGGMVPFSNYDNTGELSKVQYQWFGPPSPYRYGFPVTNGIAQLMAGPEIDQLQPVPNAWWDFTWFGPSEAGLFDDGPYPVPTVNPSQTVYYQVWVTYPEAPGHVQVSTMLKLVAGGGAQPTPFIGSLKFPYYAEWPTPVFDTSFTAWMQNRVLGEITSLKMRFDFGFGYTPQWRKDGKPISGATNVSGGLISFTSELVITNTHPEDAGIYDLTVGGPDSWAISPKISVSVQTQSGAGVFQSPRQSGNQFQADFIGAAGRNYMVECSTNLVNWINLLTLTNTTGTLVFSNSIPPDGNLFYRSRLLP